eukprot:s83_g3.t1
MRALEEEEGDIAVLSPVLSLDTIGHKVPAIDLVLVVSSHSEVSDGNVAIFRGVYCSPNSVLLVDNPMIDHSSWLHSSAAAAVYWDLHSEILACAHRMYLYMPAMAFGRLGILELNASSSAYTVGISKAHFLHPSWLCGSIPERCDRENDGFGVCGGCFAIELVAKSQGRSGGNTTVGVQRLSAASVLFAEYPDQRFDLLTTGQLQNINSGLCVNVTDPEDGTDPVVLMTPCGSTEPSFELDNYSRLVVGGRCVNSTGSTNGDSIVTVECTPEENTTNMTLSWEFVESTTVSTRCAELCMLPTGIWDIWVLQSSALDTCECGHLFREGAVIFGSDDLCCKNHSYGYKDPC